MRFLPALLPLLLVGCSADTPQAAKKADRIDCKGVQTCESEAAKLAASENEMQASFESAINRIKECEPANSTKCFDQNGAIAAIRAEQSAWTPWRNSHCDVFAFSMADTSAEGELKAFCRRDLTEKRNAELKKVMAS